MDVLAWVIIGLAELALDNKSISINATYVQSVSHYLKPGVKKRVWASDRADQRWEEHKDPRNYR